MQSSLPAPETNTPLLNAILANETEAALALIKEDSNINQASLGNTALLLALKLGNVTVSNRLLERADIDVNAYDCFGMNALHWACFMRLDDVIEKILVKNPVVELFPDPAYMSATNCVEYFKKLTPLDFYLRQLNDLDKLDRPKHLKDRGDLIHAEHYEPFLYMINPNDKVRYAKKLPILLSKLVHVPLTTLAFHMYHICINYCGVTPAELIAPDTLRDYAGAKGYVPDQEVWATNFKYGYPLFQQARQSRKVSEHICQQLMALTVPTVEQSPPRLK